MISTQDLILDTNKLESKLIDFKKHLEYSTDSITEILEFIHRYQNDPMNYLYMNDKLDELIYDWTFNCTIKQDLKFIKDYHDRLIKEVKE